MTFELLGKFSLYTLLFLAGIIIVKRIVNAFKDRA
jgi:hypothetical protein